ncbi:MAG: glycosyl transferase group 1 [Acidobacteriaceae bacterium]|jgi:glycosyltransferase involved in cell wall biosynthesis|nr:glycosyl transferase group 1 [Acidobacteriaceae bacterium]
MVSKAHVVGAYHGKLREMARLGVDLTLIVPPDWGNQKLEIFHAEEYKIRVVPCLLSGYNHFHFYRELLGKINADLVHIDEEPWSLVTYQFMRLCVKQNKPAVFFTWQNIQKKYPPPFNFFERYTFRHVRAAIAGNEEARDILRTRHFSKPVMVIPQFGVDPEFFYKRDISDLKNKLELTDKFVIGYMGRILEEKGIADLLRVLSSLPENCVLVLVGNGKFRIQAERLASELGVSSRTYWFPQISSFNVPEYMNLFDVLVLPSRTTWRWKEQFGRVLVEAMACETPVIGSSSGEIPNVIGDAGSVFPEGNVDALRQCLGHLYDSPGFAEEIGAKGRTRVLKNFVHRHIAEQTVRLYENAFTT